MKSHLKGKKRIFVCGLALDFCVMDTCINATFNGFKDVHYVLDAARAAHIPGVGLYGSGFLSDPQDVRQKLTDAKISENTLKGVKVTISSTNSPWSLQSVSMAAIVTTSSKISSMSRTCTMRC